MNFTPFPELHTERLVLRQIQFSDSDVIWYLRSDPGVTKYIKRAKTKTREEAEAFIEMITTGIQKNEWISWAITLKGNESLIGTICFWNFSQDYKTAEVGYDLSPLHQGKGIMHEAMQGVIEYGFDTLQLHLIEALTHRNNQSSKKLLEKNNFQYNPKRKDEDNKDNSIFELINKTPPF